MTPLQIVYTILTGYWMLFILATILFTDRKQAWIEPHKDWLVIPTIIIYARRFRYDIDKKQWIETRVKKDSVIVRRVMFSWLKWSVFVGNRIIE